MSYEIGNPITYTPQVIADRLISDISSNESQQASLETELSTGNRINQPSDDPAGTATVMQLNSSIARANQYVANANDGLGWLSLGNSTMNSILSGLQQVRQLVVSVTSAQLTGGSTALQGISQQVDSVRSQLLNLSNTLYDGQAIFAGTGNVTNAYDANGNYVGGGSAPTRTVAPGTQVSISVTGPDIFGTGSDGLLGPNGILAQISQDISTGSTASLQKLKTTDWPALDAATNQTESQAAVLGANYQRMQGFVNQAQAAQTALQTEASSIDGANVATTMSNLSQAQTSYQAALWAVSQLSQSDLVKFLG